MSIVVQLVCFKICLLNFGHVLNVLVNVQCVIHQILVMHAILAIICMVQLALSHAQYNILLTRLLYIVNHALHLVLLVILQQFAYPAVTTFYSITHAFLHLTVQLVIFLTFQLCLAINVNRLA